MAARKVIWSSRAKNELKGVLTFYIDRNKSTAYSTRLLSEVEKLTNLLPKFPYLGRVTTNGKTRVVVKGRFLIFYEVYTNV